MSVTAGMHGVGVGPAVRAAEPMDGVGTLRWVRDLLSRRWLEISGTALLVIVAAIILVRIVPPRFAARADVMLDPRHDKAFGPDDMAGTVNLDTATVEGAQAMIKGNGVLLRVVRSENLATDPDFDGSRDTAGLRWGGIATLLGHREPRPSTPEQHAVGTLFRALKVERVGKAFVLSITATAREPERAARLANAVAEGFVLDQRQARLEASRREAAFFAERLGPLGEQLRRSEDALDRFRREHDLQATAAHGQETDRPASLNEQQLAELNTRLAAARAETAQAWAHYDEARATVARGGGMETIPDVVRSVLISQLRQQAAEVARKEADLAARYTDSYPALVTVRAERREIDRAIAREMARIVANLRGAYEIAKSQEDGLRANVTLTTGAAGLDSDVGRQLRELERVKLVDQTVFETYLARAKAAEQQSNFEEHDVRVISPASAPVVPAFPQTKLTLFCAALLGLGAGVAFGCLRDALETGYRTVQQAEAGLEPPVLASIPWQSASDRTVEGKRVDLPRLLARRPHGSFGEAVHALRAALGRRIEGGSTVMLVASALPGEGRTTLAMSLALSTARSGRRVLVIDADLRQPGLSRSLGLENRLGLVDMLSGIVGTEETTVPLGPGLAIMPAGRGAAIAADLFGSRRMRIYCDHLRAIYDLVLIDAAPAEVAADAGVLSHLADAVLFVIGCQTTPKDVAARGLARMAPGTVTGAVLNKAPRAMQPAAATRRRSALVDAEA
jgi:polysaccharide biosynthesis transport protein